MARRARRWPSRGRGRGRPTAPWSASGHCRRTGPGPPTPRRSRTRSTSTPTTRARASARRILGELVRLAADHGFHSVDRPHRRRPRGVDRAPRRVRLRARRRRARGRPQVQPLARRRRHAAHAAGALSGLPPRLLPPSLFCRSCRLLRGRPLLRRAVFFAADSGRSFLGGRRLPGSRTSSRTATSSGRTCSPTRPFPARSSRRACRRAPGGDRGRVPRTSIGCASRVPRPRRPALDVPGAGRRTPAPAAAVAVSTDSGIRLDLGRPDSGPSRRVRTVEADRTARRGYRDRRGVPVGLERPRGTPRAVAEVGRW